MAFTSHFCFLCKSGKLDNDTTLRFAYILLKSKTKANPAKLFRFLYKKYRTILTADIVNRYMKNATKIGYTFRF